MLRNYLTIALRNFKKQKLFVLLNTFGLGLGLACAIFIFLYVSDELQYDVMHPHYRDTYRIGISFTNAEGQTFNNTVAPGFLSRYLRDNRSEVTNITRIDYIGYPTSLHHKPTDKILLTEEIKWVEPNFHEVIGFNLLHGSVDRMFENQNTMIISEQGARRLFADRDPIGEVISVKHNFATNGQEIDVMITGVYQDFPTNSHFKAKYLININAFRNINPNFDNYFEGTRFADNISFFENYVVLQSGADPEPVEETLNEQAALLISRDSAISAQGFKATAFMTPVRDLHFDPDNLWENDSTRGNKTYLAIFSAVAFMILLIACINYMNLATARSARRAREVGLRKSLGGRRRELAWQFFCESFLLTMGALAVALVLVVAFMQPFNTLAHKAFALSSLADPLMIGIVLGIIVFMTLLSGSYPAIYLSGFRPVDVLKGQVVKGKAAEFFRKSLVTIQYVVAILLIISTLVVIRQMQYMQHTQLNEAGSQILSIRYGGTAPQSRFEAFRQSVLQDPDIEYVTMANHLPRLDYFGFIGTSVRLPGLNENSLDWNQLNVDFYFARTYGLEIVAGRDFDPSNPADSNSVILNEAALRALNQPVERVLGTAVEETYFNQPEQRQDVRSLKVIGIVKDFPFRSMHQAIEPLMLNPHLHFIDRIAYIKLPAGDFGAKVEAIEKKWKELYPGAGFDYWFVSDEFNRMYLTERRVSSLARVFAVLAVVITVLGVFGLASYTAEQKTKEVGIRKVLGAHVSQVVGMFVLVFVKIFFLATLVALPLTYLLADYWLEQFVYRSPLGPDLFVISLIGLLLLTLVTVGYEVMKAARMNPVVSLRSE